jgi:predicted HTH transcriptional regulator
MVPNPKDVFERPDAHWALLTTPEDVNFEGHHFDRKEAGRVHNGKLSLKEVKEEITECLSAFGNAEGGLLVLGISTKGEPKGISHLSDDQQKQLTSVEQLLVHQNAQIKFHPYDNGGRCDELIFIHMPRSMTGICETPGGFPKAWMRQGRQNIPLTSSAREQLMRDRQFTSFETTRACAYDERDLASDVLAELRKSLPESALRDEDFLYQIGALQRTKDGMAFTNAGLLFFATNPQRVLPAATVRLLKYEITLEHATTTSLPTFDRTFTGPLTKQIRDLRAFFKGSAFFKIYQRRGPTSGFTEEPEYPHIAVDEAIVNAVAHREYAQTFPIECRYYKDAFIVTNAGRVLQRHHHVPDRFSLETTTLDSTPRNPKLMEWLRTMRDAQGAQFVKALAEGTKTMERAMKDAALPSPEYTTNIGQTTVLLRSNAPQRETQLRQAEASTERSNLFRLQIIAGQLDWKRDQRALNAALRTALEAQAWFIDRVAFGRIVAHRRGSEFALPPAVNDKIRIYPSYTITLRLLYGQPYACIDYGVQVKNVQTLAQLLRTCPSMTFAHRWTVVRWKQWQRAKIISTTDEHATVRLAEYDSEVTVANTDVIPDVPTKLFDHLLAGTRFDLYREIKRRSLASEAKAARARLDKTTAAATELAQTIFPLKLTDVTVALDPVPVGLNREEQTRSSLPAYALTEPMVEFGNHYATPDVREGITRYGAYNTDPRTIELIPISTTNGREAMAGLIERLKGGAHQYRGVERTFKARFTYPTIITVNNDRELLGECQRLLLEHPDWGGNFKLDRIFLVHTPEAAYALDDERSPYYQVKRFLLEQGVPCQMVDTPTLQNPDWKDLNLALNITAKCGITPWVLPEGIPDADFFVGISYTQQHGQRHMGYANVFNHFGRWEFYSGSTTSFRYEERAAHFKDLVKTTLERIPALSPTPMIYFHYSAKFSRDDRDAILEAARSVRPQGRYAFVWLNMHHQLRLYDLRPETDGSLPRGHYVITSPYQAYLSTTGNNPYRRALGTPHMLELNIWMHDPKTPTPDLRALANQILSLTKLNWASTDSFCGEPITTKYAGDIAYLAAAFLRQSDKFTLHPVLEQTPWFI